MPGDGQDCWPRNPPHGKLTADSLGRRVSADHTSGTYAPCHAGLRLPGLKAIIHILLERSQRRGKMFKDPQLVRGEGTQIVQDRRSHCLWSKRENTPYYVSYYSCKSLKPWERNKKRLLKPHRSRKALALRPSQRKHALPLRAPRETQEGGPTASRERCWAPTFQRPGPGGWEWRGSVFPCEDLPPSFHFLSLGLGKWHPKA